MEKGDLWALLSNNGENPTFAKLLDYDKRLEIKSAEHINVTNGKIEVHPDSQRILLALGIVDKRDLDRKDAKFALLVANSMFEAALVTENQLQNIPKTIDDLNKKIIKNEGRAIIYFKR